MNVIGKQVKHKAFGNGKITEQNETRITVQFSDDYGSKMFLFPDTFEKCYLTFSNSALQATIDSIIVQARQKEETGRRQREEEAERLREEQRIAALMAKRAAKKRTTTEKKK